MLPELIGAFVWPAYGPSPWDDEPDDDVGDDFERVRRVAWAALTIASFSGGVVLSSCAGPPPALPIAATPPDPSMTRRIGITGYHYGSCEEGGIMAAVYLVPEPCVVAGAWRDEHEPVYRYEK